MMNPAEIAGAFAMGLVGSTHCVAMCGGIVGVQNASMPVQLRTKPIKQLPLSLAYNAGRISTYTLLGFVAGGASMFIDGIVPLHIARVLLQVVAALCVIGVGLHLLGVFPAFQIVERAGAPLWARLRPFAMRWFSGRTIPHALAFGALWGFLPCGLVYSAVAVALSRESALSGALTMLAFGLGTLPALLAMSSVAGSFALALKKPMFRLVAGAFLCGIGIVSLAVVPTIASSAPTEHLHCH